MSLNIARQIVLTPSDQLNAFAYTSLGQIEGVFDRFFAAYELYQRNLIAWNAEYAPQTSVYASGQNANAYGPAVRDDTLSYTPSVAAAVPESGFVQTTSLPASNAAANLPSDSNDAVVQQLPGAGSSGSSGAFVQQLPGAGTSDSGALCSSCRGRTHPPAARSCSNCRGRTCLRPARLCSSCRGRTHPPAARSCSNCPGRQIRQQRARSTVRHRAWRPHRGLTRFPPGKLRQATKVRPSATPPPALRRRRIRPAPMCGPPPAATAYRPNSGALIPFNPAKTLRSYRVSRRLIESLYRDSLA